MIDLLLKNGLVVTMDSKRTILDNASVAVDKGKIVGVGTSRKLDRKYSARETIDASNAIIMPGLICAHTHLYGMLLRGAPLRILPPSDFTEILQRVWWPVDEALTYADAYASALGACVEFAKNGTTLFADTYSGPNSIAGVLDQIAKAVDEVGIRGLVAFEATERHSREEGERGVAENVRFAVAARSRPQSKAMPLFSIHASFTVSDPLIRRVRGLATKYRVPITIHASEGLGDIHHNMENYGKRTLERLRDVGLLGPDVVLAHCVHLTDEELDIISETRAKVAHNPMSNMLNAVGVAPVVKMLKKGLTVGLGNDGYIFDMFENLRVAFLLHRVSQLDPNAIDAYTLLEMVTIKAAELYGLGHKLGSVVKGKQADLIVIKPELMPTPLTPHTAVSHLIHSVDGDDVQTVIVGGKMIMKDRKLLTVSENEAQRVAQEAAGKLWSRLQKVPPQIDLVRKQVS